MTIKLIDGHFQSAEALEIITKMIHVKISFHEDKINQSQNEEDIKMREKRIKQLQKDLYDVRQHIEATKKGISMNADIEL
jgi:3-methyladenine DNA glycosylase/8-oxoguanine DNA glycosylase